jgi:hypothetical protein
MGQRVVLACRVSTAAQSSHRQERDLRGFAERGDSVSSVFTKRKPPRRALPRAIDRSLVGTCDRPPIVATEAARHTGSKPGPGCDRRQKRMMNINAPPWALLPCRQCSGASAARGVGIAFGLCRRVVENADITISRRRVRPIPICSWTFNPPDHGGALCDEMAIAIHPAHAFECPAPGVFLVRPVPPAEFCAHLVERGNVDGLTILDRYVAAGGRERPVKRIPEQRAATSAQARLKLCSYSGVNLTDRSRACARHSQTINRELLEC